MNAVPCLEEEVGGMEGYKATSGRLGDTEEVKSPCMTWPHENGQLKGDCSSRDEGKPAGCPCSQSSLNFSAHAPPDFLGNTSNQLSMRPEVPLLGFLWSEAVLPNL